MNLFSYFVTFDWLKCSSRIGEWLNVNKYQPKNFLTKNSFLNFYRKNRHDKKALQVFHQSGCIYLTSIVEQRSLLLKLVTFLGGNVCFSLFFFCSDFKFCYSKITINRNRAKIIVGQSSKSLQILNYPQVTEQWIIGLFDLVFFCCKINRFFEYLDSIISIKCLPFDKYLIENAKNT